MSVMPQCHIVSYAPDVCVKASYGTDVCVKASYGTDICVTLSVNHTQTVYLETS